MVTTAALIVAAVLFGGANAQGKPGDALVVLAAIPLLAWAVFHHLARGDGYAVAIVALAVAVPALQLFPWPWGDPPWSHVHQAWQFDQLRVFGIAPPGVASVAPDATLRALLYLLPPAAVFLAVLALPARERGWVAGLVVAAAVVSAVWAIAQVTIGDRVAITFHSGTQGSQAKGFFSNRNHFAALMYTGVALGGVALLAVIRRMVAAPDPARIAPLAIAWSLGMLLVLVALMLAQSRAGVALGALVLVLLLAAGVHGLGQAVAGARRWFVSALMVGVVVAIQLGLWGVLARFEADPFEDGRVVVHRITLDAAREAAPWGTGLGTFRRVYEQREPLEAVQSTYVNRAHNDWLEFYLEAGWAAVVVAVAWLVWWIARLWRRRADAEAADDAWLRYGAGLAVLAVALHSFVDFPLRTMSMAVVTAALLAISVPVRNSARHSANGGDARALQASANPQEAGARPAGQPPATVLPWRQAAQQRKHARPDPASGLAAPPNPPL